MYYWFINNSFKRKTQLSDYSIQDKHGKVKKNHSQFKSKSVWEYFQKYFYSFSDFPDSESYIISCKKWMVLLMNDYYLFSTIHTLCSAV